MKKLLFIFIFISVNLYGQNVHYSKQITNDSIFIDFINGFFAPVEFDLSLKVDSLKSNVKFENRLVVPPKDTIKNSIRFSLKAIKDTAKFNLNTIISIKWILGDSRNSKHDESYLYTLPYKKKKAYTVTQGFNGKKSHNSEKSRYAIDFNMSIGDTVCAAREGIVALVQEDFTEHGGKEFIYKANRIIILHTDGTMASYAHLDYKGSFVKAGDSVQKGQPIGKSGLTGYTSGPHLHFVVREARDISVPINFEGYENKTIKRRRKYRRRF